MSETKDALNPARRQAALIFIFVTVLLDVLSLGVTIPVGPSLITNFCGGDHKQGMFYNGWFVTTWAAMQFIFSPLMGALSDRFGRRRVILLSCTGLGLDYILMALAPNLTWLFIGRVLSGITAASFSTAAAYIADITPPEKRAASYGIFGAAFGLGFVVGPAVGGLLSVYGLRIPFWVAAGLTLLNAAYGFWILPESLSEKNRSKFSWKKANPVGSLKLLRGHPELLGLASIFFLYYLAHQVFQSVFVIYANYRYNWEPQMVGLTLTAVGLASVFVQGFLVRKAAKRLGEWKMLLIALVFGMAGYTIYGLATNGWIFWCAIPVFSLVGFFSAAIQGLMTRHVAVDEQGQLQGANSSMMGIAGMIGPTIFSIAFYRTSFTGLPFILAASLHVLAIGVAVYLVNKQPLVSPQPPAAN